MKLPGTLPGFLYIWTNRKNKMSSASLPPSNRWNKFILYAVMVLAALILYMVLSPLCAFLLSAAIFWTVFIIFDNDDE